MPLPAAAACRLLPQDAQTCGDATLVDILDVSIELAAQELAKECSLHLLPPLLAARLQAAQVQVQRQEQMEQQPASSPGGWAKAAAAWRPG